MTDTETSSDRSYKNSVRQEWTAAASGWRKWMEIHEAKTAAGFLVAVASTRGLPLLVSPPDDGVAPGCDVIPPDAPE